MYLPPWPKMDTELNTTTPPPGRLWLIPNTLDLGCIAEDAPPPDLQDVLPMGVLRIAAGLTHWIAENAKTTRAFLKRVDGVVPLSRPLQEHQIQVIPRPGKGRADKPRGPAAWRELLAPALAGHDVGLISEAGLPAVADPGADVVLAAHRLGLKVQALSGPSSLLLAQAASASSQYALALDRRARGLPANSIAWGVWADTGLVRDEAGRLIATIDPLGRWTRYERDTEGLRTVRSAHTGKPLVLRYASDGRGHWRRLGAEAHDGRRVVRRATHRRLLDDFGREVLVDNPDSGRELRRWIQRPLRPRAAREHRSIALEADAKHLVTDVWTSAGVVIGIALVQVTGWLWLDALVAMGVALNIMKEGVHLIWRSSQGLMDEAVEPEVLATIQDTLAGFASSGSESQIIRFDHLNTRKAGQRRFVDLHMHMPAQWSLGRAAAVRASVEQALMSAVPGLRATIQLLPSDVEAHFDDPRDLK